VPLREIFAACSRGWKVRRRPARRSGGLSHPLSRAVISCYCVKGAAKKPMGGRWWTRYQEVGDASAAQDDCRMGERAPAQTVAQQAQAQNPGTTADSMSVRCYIGLGSNSS